MKKSKKMYHLTKYPRHQWWKLSIINFISVLLKIQVDIEGIPYGKTSKYLPKPLKEEI